MKLLFRTMVVLLVLCLALPLGVAQAADPPYAPQLFYGEVTIGDVPATDGARVSAWIDYIEYASANTSGGEYQLEVPGEDPAVAGKQGGEPGDTVVLKVSGTVADSQPFEPGMPTELDLAIAGVPGNQVPAAPSEPSPADGASDIAISVALSVLVSDPDGDAMTVTFYDASDDSGIGTVEGVSSGNRAEVTWSGLNYEAPYSWYAVASDGELENQSATWSFTTVTVPSDSTPPVIEYACIFYYIGAESARPGDLFEVAAVVTDNDTGVTLVKVETWFGTSFPLLGEEYEGITFYWAFDEVPEDTPPGTYELNLIAEDAAGNTANRTLELEVVLSLTAYNIRLADGWNLISLPLIPDPTAIETVLAGLSFSGEDMARAVWEDEIADGMMPILDSVWYYDAVGEYGTAGEWLFFEPDEVVGDLTEMEDGKGYWVDVVISPIGGGASHGVLTVYGVELVSGPTLPPTYPVVEGWNLIGFKETRGMHFSQYLSAVEGQYSRIYGFNAYNQCFYLVGQGGPEYMHPGSGYWIYMTEGGYIVP